MRLRLAIVLGLLVGIVTVGTTGYHLLEGWTWLDAFYMTVISLTTVGYGEVRPLSSAGQIFTIGLIITGVGSVAYGAATLADTVVAGTVGRILRKSSVEAIDTLRGHTIICGYGRLGRYLSRYLAEEGISFVIIESDTARAASAVGDGHYAVEGDATDEEVLMRAGLGRAKAVIAGLGSDADNLFVTLSAREINPQCTVVARAEDPSAEKKLQRAGAHKVVSPLRMGSLRMSQAIARPAVVDFIEVITETPELDLVMEGVTVAGGCSLVGQTLAGSGIGRDLGLIIIAIRRTSDHMIFNPTADTIIEAEDTLITMGEAEQLSRLRALACAHA